MARILQKEPVDTTLNCCTEYHNYLLYGSAMLTVHVVVKIVLFGSSLASASRRPPALHVGGATWLN